MPTAEMTARSSNPEHQREEVRELAEVRGNDAAMHHRNGPLSHDIPNPRR
jgi:hypothetical protein